MIREIALVLVLVLLMSGNAKAQSCAPDPIPPFDCAFAPTLHGLSVSQVKAIIWPGDNPIDNPEQYPVTIDAPLKINYHRFLTSRVKVVEPSTPTGKYMIYHAGHTAPGVIEPPESWEAVNWAVNLGYAVYWVDMPVNGHNTYDWNRQSPLNRNHGTLSVLENESADSPLGLFLQPVSVVVNEIYKGGPPDELVMMGHSGGGWTTLWYAALDPRIDKAVVAQGVAPQSVRWRLWGAYDLIRPGDYEQRAPHVYDYVSYEDLIVLCGGRCYYTYNTNDTCCFNFVDGEPYIDWMRGIAGDVFVDNSYQGHKISPNSYLAIEGFLAEGEGNRTDKSIYLPVILAQKKERRLGRSGG